MPASARRRCLDAQSNATWYDWLIEALASFINIATLTTQDAVDEKTICLKDASG
jgi:hypothetical protein